jgi:hypothetical protein
VPVREAMSASAEPALESLTPGDPRCVLALVRDQRSVSRLLFGLHTDAYRAAPSRSAIAPLTSTL